MILVVILYAVLASTFIFAKKALMYANPCFLIGSRMIVAGSLLLGYQWFFGKEKVVIKREDFFTFFQAALYHIYFAFILEFWALQYVTALKTTMIYSSTPFIAAILSFFLLKERLTVRKKIGVVIGLAGLLPVLLTQVQGLEASLELSRISMPEIVLFIAVISATYAWFIVSKLMNKGYPFSVINGIAMLIGGVLSMITAGFVEGFSHPVTELLPFLGWMVLLIISANFIVYNLYAWLLKRYSITFISFSGFLCPGFAALYDWFFMSGTLQWQTVISLGIITLGLYVFYKDELRRMTQAS